MLCSSFSVGKINLVIFLLPLFATSLGTYLVPLFCRKAHGGVDLAPGTSLSGGQPGVFTMHRASGPSDLGVSRFLDHPYPL